MNDKDEGYVNIVIPRYQGTFSTKFFEEEIDRISKAARIVADFMRELDPSDPSLTYFADQMMENLYNDSVRSIASRGGNLVGNLAAFIVATSDTTPSLDAARKFRKIVLAGSMGGREAAKNRSAPRKKVSEKIKKLISERGYWDSWNETLQSITGYIWSEIEKAISNDQDWEGISNDELHKAQIGRQTVYDVVKETDPR